MMGSSAGIAASILMTVEVVTPAYEKPLFTIYR
jgi:hypothetical protein